MSAVIQLPTPTRATRSQIEAFLAQKRIAIVGVSRNRRDFTRMMFKEFRQRGYDVVPVNPAVAEIEGARCYPSLREAPSVSAVLLMTSPEVTLAVLEECVTAGVKQVWMYRAVGREGVDESAAQVCREAGIDLIAGECPFMFFRKPGFPHNLHGVLRKILGTYPA